MTSNFQLTLVMVCLMALVGCSNPKLPDSKPDFAKGNQIFNRSCAECHLNPESEAQQLDESDDWDMRTPHWNGVLKDHVKNGYLEMPKVGQSGVTDQNMSDVLHYMEVKIRALP